MTGLIAHHFDENAVNCYLRTADPRLGIVEDRFAVLTQGFNENRQGSHAQNARARLTGSIGAVADAATVAWVSLEGVLKLGNAQTRDPHCDFMARKGWSVILPAGT